ncbi:unnamed protein product, partial [Phaeothamnion confervicola]
GEHTRGRPVPFARSSVCSLIKCPQSSLLEVQQWVSESTETRGGTHAMRDGLGKSPRNGMRSHSMGSILPQAAAPTPGMLRRRSSHTILPRSSRTDTATLQRVLMGLVAAATLTTLMVLPMFFPSDSAIYVHQRPPSLPPLPELPNLSPAAKDAVAIALAMDSLLKKEHGVCPDTYGVFGGPAPSMADLLNLLSSASKRGPPELQRLRAGRYFIAAIAHDDEPLLPFWQRELVKIVLLLGNAARDNLFVSVHDIGSNDRTKVCLLSIADLLQVLGVAHVVTSGDRVVKAPLSASELPALRNRILAPLYATMRVEYDAVLHLSVSHYFCASSVVPLVAAVRGRPPPGGPVVDNDGAFGGRGAVFGNGFGTAGVGGVGFNGSDAHVMAQAGGGGNLFGIGGGTRRILGGGGNVLGADIACSMDYTDAAASGSQPRTLRGQEEKVTFQATDVWVARDLGGCNMVSRETPHWCDPTARRRFVAGAPVPLFSCWDGAVATDADLFQRLGLRFRWPGELECRQNEADLLAKDVWTAGRGSVVMLPGVRTALEWDTFKRLAAVDAAALGASAAGGAGNGDNALAGGGSGNALAGGGGGRAGGGGGETMGLLPADWWDDMPVLLRPPAAITCCPMDDGDGAVRLRECFWDRHWGRAVEINRVAGGTGGGDGAGFDRDGKPLPVGPAAGAGGATSLAALEAQLQGYVVQNKLTPFCTDVAAGAAALAGSIPRRVVHFGGLGAALPRDAQNRLATAAVSFVAAHDGCYDYDLVTDEQLAAQAAALSENLPVVLSETLRNVLQNVSFSPPESSAGWLDAVERPEMRTDVLRLLYLLRHGGVMAPLPASAAGSVTAHLRQGDRLVLGFVNAPDGPRLLYMAAEPGHP